VSTKELKKCSIWLCACFLFLVMKKEECRGGEEREGSNYNLSVPHTL